MFFQNFAPLWSLAMAGFVGYRVSGVNGAVLGGVIWGGLNLYFLAFHVYQRQDYWASKLAMLDAEKKVLRQSLAEMAAGQLLQNNRAIADAYRVRLAMLDAETKALRVGYASEKAAGLGGHGSPQRSGLLPEAAPS